MSTSVSVKKVINQLMMIEDVKVGVKIKLLDLIKLISKQVNEFQVKQDKRIISELYGSIPLLIRFSIDEGIKAIESNDDLRLVNEFTQQSIKLFKAVIKSEPGEALRLVKGLINSGFVRIHRSSMVFEPEDLVTKQWSKPRFVIELLEHIKERIPDKKLVILNFAHGSTRVALLLGVLLEFIGYEIINLPVRFSVKKLGDEGFKFIKKDGLKELINLLGRGYEVLILDEDVSSGITFKKAYEYITNSVLNNYKRDIFMGAIGVSAVFAMDVMHLIDIAHSKVYELASLKRGVLSEVVLPINLLLVLNYITKRFNKRVILIKDESFSKRVNIRIEQSTNRVKNYLESMNFDVKVMNIKELINEWPKLRGGGFNVLVLSGGVVSNQSLLNSVGGFDLSLYEHLYLLNLERYVLFTPDEDLFLVEPSGLFGSKETFNPEDFKVILRTIRGSVKKRINHSQNALIQHNIEQIIQRAPRLTAQRIIELYKTNKDLLMKHLSEQDISDLISKFKN